MKWICGVAIWPTITARRRMPQDAQGIHQHEVTVLICSLFRLSVRCTAISAVNWHFFYSLAHSVFRTMK